MFIRTLAPVKANHEQDIVYPRKNRASKRRDVQYTKLVVLHVTHTSFHHHLVSGIFIDLSLALSSPSILISSFFFVHPPASPPLNFECRVLYLSCSVVLEFIILAYLVFELYSFHSLFEFFVYAATIVISLIEYYTLVYAPYQL